MNQIILSPYLLSKKVKLYLEANRQNLGNSLSKMLQARIEAYGVIVSLKYRTTRQPARPVVESYYKAVAVAVACILQVNVTCKKRNLKSFITARLAFLTHQNRTMG